MSRRRRAFISKIALRQKTLLGLCWCGHVQREAISSNQDFTALESYHSVIFLNLCLNDHEVKRKITAFMLQSWQESVLRSVLPDDIALHQKLSQLTLDDPAFFVRALCIGTHTASTQRSHWNEWGGVGVFSCSANVGLDTTLFFFPTVYKEKQQLHYPENGSFDVIFPSLLKHWWQLMFTYQRTYEFKMNAKCYIRTLIRN